jgi:hypothetical protein
VPVPAPAAGDELAAAPVAGVAVAIMVDEVDVAAGLELVAGPEEVGVLVLVVGEPDVLVVGVALGVCCITTIVPLPSFVAARASCAKPRLVTASTRASANEEPANVSTRCLNRIRFLSAKRE